MTELTYQQGALAVILAGTLGLFISGVWRYDVVALLSLVGVTLIGAVDPGDAFRGFGHAAVVTVAMVLILSRALEEAGVANLLAELIQRVGKNSFVQFAVLTASITAVSGFMNNIGALAIFMPVAINLARSGGSSPSLLLMPLAFGSLLGGMTTLIGTPPNLIVSSFREEALGEPYGIFAFSPVGVSVAVGGVLFLILLGWRFLPEREGVTSSDALFDIQSYLTELRVRNGGPLSGTTVEELLESVEGEFVVLGIVRNGRQLSVVSMKEKLRDGDILMVEADSGVLEELTGASSVEIVADKKLGTDALGGDDVVVMEAVVTPQSSVLNRTPNQLRLHSRFGVNLVAVARHGRRLRQRFNAIRLRASDVLLLRGSEQSLYEATSAIGCLPLAYRSLTVGRKRNLLLTTAIFAAALTLVVTGTLAIQVSFLIAIVLMLLLGLISLKELYASVEWPIIILLGAMIPVGQALETTGTAELVARQLIDLGQWLPSWGALAAILIGTMFLSDLVNNAAAAVLVAPIALNVANGLAASPDPYLMAVAVGASCAFLTPIGHQSSALVMGPGGYSFGDYWKLGLPLELLIVLIALPALLYFWPL